MSRLQPGEQRPCLKCGMPIVGARSLVTKSRPGKVKHEPGAEPVLPVTLAPTPDGNVLIQRIDGELRAIVFGRSDLLELLRSHGVQLRLCHFANCEFADDFRRKPPAPTRPEGNTAA